MEPTILEPRSLDAEASGTRAEFFDYLLRLGDDSLILSQRMSEWCGHAPALEIELGLANIGLDLIGQSIFFLTLAGEIENDGRDADTLAFHRDARDFRNCLLVEQPNGDFAQTIARQFLFSTAQLALFEDLSDSTEPRIAAIASKAAKEVAYHADLAAEWVIRLGDGTEISRARMIAAFEWFWRFVDEMFDMDAIELGLMTTGIAADRASHRARFDARVDQVLIEATLPLPRYPRAVTGGRSGNHSEHLGHLLATLQFLPRAYPDAKW